MSEPEDAAEPIGALHVLLVHGLSGQAAVVRGLLEADGHRVTMVHDWRMAEAMLALHVIGAVVMAVTMPGGPRGTAARLLRASTARWASLPLVGLGAGARLHEARIARDEGFDAVVTAPFDAAALSTALRDALRLRQPPMLLDPTIRAALRASHSPAALAARDEAAMAQVAQLLEPVLSGAADRAAIGEALAAAANALQAVGATHAAALARGLLEAGPPPARNVRPVLQVMVGSRFALRTDRMTAAREDPIWAASDTPSGETP